MKIKALYVMTSLSMGGAQKALLNLLQTDIGKQYPALVVTLVESNGLEQAFQQANISLHTLSLNKPWRLPKRLWQLRKLLKQQPLQFIHGWQHHGNLVATLIWKWQYKQLPLFWSMHHTPETDTSHSWKHRLILSLGKHYSHFPRKVIYVSERSRQRHIALGYRATNTQVIPNGVHVPSYEEVAKPINGLPDDAFIIGSLTRYVEEKDIPCLLEAAELLVQKAPKVHFVLAGEGMSPANNKLMQQIKVHNLQERIHLLGVCSNANALIQQMDIATLSSRREAFPLFLAEAMALQVPVVATDVGDIAEFVGDTGRVVAKEQPKQLAQAWYELYNMPEKERLALGERAKAKVVTTYSLDRVQQAYQQLLADNIVV